MSAPDGALATGSSRSGSPVPGGRYHRAVSANPSAEVLDDGIEKALALGGRRRSTMVTVIEPRRRIFQLADARELWAFRELAFTLAWRDLSVRYKQTFVGVAWAVLQPFMTMVVFTIIFGKFAKLPSDGLPYTVFVYSGLLPWTYFAASLLTASNSVVTNRALVSRVYFPRILLPLGSPIVPAVDFLVASVVLIGMVGYYGLGFSWTLLVAPFFLVLGALVAIAFGLILATLNVRYRDVPYAVPFVIQLWLYVSPVIYATNGLPEKWARFIAFNPLNVVISGFRWAVVGSEAPPWWQVATGSAVTVVILVFGLFVFQRGQARFADTI